MVLLKEDILFHQGMYLHKDPQRVFVWGRGNVLTEPRSRAAAPEPRAMAAEVLGTEMAGRKGKPGQLAKYRAPFLSF